MNIHHLLLIQQRASDLIDYHGYDIDQAYAYAETELFESLEREDDDYDGYHSL